ncbi:MAG: NADH-quinone oxidoreductase subunit A [Oligoflexia bacterium]|nr:NADH-quinone oxidoreductase subunit A [Oligoflexia bacterium]
MIEDQNLISYFSILLVFIVATFIAVIILLLNKILGKRPREFAPTKSDTYECGVPYVGSAREQFSVRYYLLAVIFLLFDVEVVLMYPWAYVYKKFLSQGLSIVLEMAIFVVILFAGYFYLRMRKALNWD